MKKLQELFEGNRQWAARMHADAPDFFAALAQQQTPEYLWIGCSDSRVPANEILNMLPGDVFVHRNVANQVIHADMNCLSVMQYAVEVLKVKHVMVVGHYGCGGVKAALEDNHLGLIDNWLRSIRTIALKYRDILGNCTEEERLFDRLCELNAIEQAYNVATSTMVQKAWANGQELSVHALVYGLNDGLLQDLHFGVSCNEELDLQMTEAIEAVANLAG
ncbi:carbonate dehydratase [Marinobacterium jannaschii]|uniref:carbonate dehydratase n=1 Tax=Marinobacterium jannaschii TaxID=64970 RepID=UPI000485BE37|nr:carbonate dehydratase [Marinobacterium jannaschii]